MRQRLAVLVFVLLLLCSGCLRIGGAGDWKYELPNDFAILRINSRTIVLNNMKYGYGATAIDGYIISFCANDRFVGIKQALEVPENLREEIDLTRYQFYLVDTLTWECHGPYENEECYAAACAAQRTDDLGSWLDTSPAPKGSEFG